MGKSTGEFRLRGIPAVIALFTGTLVLVGASLTLGRLLPERPEPPSDTVTGSQTEFARLPEQPSIAPDSVANPALAQDSSDTPQKSKKTPTRQGLLRVGNSTEHPVRVALLLKKSAPAKNSTTGDEVSYEPPAHWDFEPGEGSNKGLLLSLPNRSLKLKHGDVLVAFAQDGSRRYWGPYVVGETTAPDWVPNSTEWQLVLQP